MHEMQDKQILTRLKTIFYDNKIHPLGKIRWVIYLLMNGHDQDSYNRATQTNPVASDPQPQENIGVDIETEIFLAGPLKYNNIMMKDYLAHLERTEPDYFERLKNECKHDDKAPQDKATFILYAQKISDYAIARDYARGGEGPGRRIYDRLKSDCHKWCAIEYHKRYKSENLDTNRLLTIALCQFLFKINILARENQRLVDLLEFKEIIRNNAGTPKTSFIAAADVSTTRPQANLPSLSLDRNKHESKNLTPEEQKQEITESMRCWFIQDLLSRNTFNSYKWQKDLPYIFLEETSLTDTFWDDQEDIESIILKIIRLIDKLKKDVTLSDIDRTNLSTVRNFFVSHKDFYTENRKEFTSLYQELLPEDFLTAIEIELTVTTLRKIKSITTAFIKKLDEYYIDNRVREQKLRDLKGFTRQIEHHILFYTSEPQVCIAYKQFAPDKFMSLEKFITNLTELTKDKITPNTLINDLVNNPAYTVTPLELTRHLIKMCAIHLTRDELKLLLINRCLVDISIDNFEERFINLCVDDLTPKRLCDILKELCTEKVSHDALKAKLEQHYRNEVSPENIKIDLKNFCCKELNISLSQLEVQIKAHCAKNLELAYYQNKLLKLCEQILIQAEKDRKKSHAVSQPIGITRRNSTESKSGSRIGNGSKPGSKIIPSIVPPIPLPASPPVSPKGVELEDKKPGLSMATINNALHSAPKGQRSPKDQPSPKGNITPRNTAAFNTTTGDKEQTSNSSPASANVEKMATSANTAEKGKSILDRAVSGFAGLFKSEKLNADKSDKKKQNTNTLDARRASDADDKRRASDAGDKQRTTPIFP